MLKLSASRPTIVDAIRQAEKGNGPAISAKFEMNRDQLMLSVYAAKNGRDKETVIHLLVLKGCSYAIRGLRASCSLRRRIHHVS